MLRKVLIGIMLVGVFSPLFANGEYYTGAGLGVNRISVANGHYQGLMPSFMWGYTNIAGSSYLSGELFGSLGSLTLQNQRSPSLRANGSVGIALLPGFLFKSIYVGYVRAGWLYSYFPSTDQYLAGAQAGLGLQANVSSNWSVRGEYDYTAYFSTTALGAPKSNQLVISALYRFN